MEVMRSALPSCFPSKSNSFPSLQCQAVLLRFLKVECRPQFSKPATLKVNAAAGKGFGKVIDKKQKRGDKAGHRICPCGGGDQQLEYVKCCKPYHDGEAVEADATTLMKARFSAYANGLVDYIVKTTHPQNPDFHVILSHDNFLKVAVEEWQSCCYHQQDYIPPSGKWIINHQDVEEQLYIHEHYREKLQLDTVWTVIELEHVVKIPANIICYGLHRFSHHSPSNHSLRQHWEMTTQLNPRLLWQTVGQSSYFFFVLVLYDEVLEYSDHCVVHKLNHCIKAMERLNSWKIEGGLLTGVLEPPVLLPWVVGEIFCVLNLRRCLEAIGRNRMDEDEKVSMSLANESQSSQSNDKKSTFKVSNLESLSSSPAPNNNILVCKNKGSCVVILLEMKEKLIYDLTRVGQFPNSVSSNVVDSKKDDPKGVSCDGQNVFIVGTMAIDIRGGARMDRKRSNIDEVEGLDNVDP
eukprot:Gb_33302 [translate_table: standard]